MKDFLIYCIVRTFLSPFQFFTKGGIFLTAKVLGHFIYYFFSGIRKRTLSNLSLASDLQLNQKEKKRVAIASLINMCITALEFSKVAHYSKYGENPKSVFGLPASIFIHDEHFWAQMASGKGAVMFVGHQSNWELALLRVGARCPSLCIVKMQRNTYVQKWLGKIRSQCSAEIVKPEGVLRACIKALESGKLVIICGEQTVTQSAFHRPFLGKRVFHTTLPALLAYKMDVPIWVVALVRDRVSYRYEFQPAVIPNKDLPKEQEVDRMTRETLSLFEESVKRKPEQWLWNYNLWKQEATNYAQRGFRTGPILLVLPIEEHESALVDLFRKIYPRSFIEVFCSTEFANQCKSDVVLLPYKKEKELFIQDNRYTLLFNFSKTRIEKHFLKQCVFRAYNLEKLTYLAKKRGLSLESPTTCDVVLYAVADQSILKI
jgi:lauroyl/myristoyl acyltransferase